MAISLIFHRLRRQIRTLLPNFFLGKIILQVWQHQQESQRSICFVAATRTTETEFWEKTLLGQRLKEWLHHPQVTHRIAFKNTRGLPEVYNEAIATATSDEILVFIHDDAWLLDTEDLAAIRRGLQTYDVIGIAGNTRRFPGQFAWYLRTNDAMKTILDVPHLSGAVWYGSIFQRTLNQFGNWPKSCELLDGVMLAARSDVLHRTKLNFDERFDFHFYDLDFSRTAISKGLKIGTWPINLLHQSQGNINDPKWKINHNIYKEKWKD